MVQLQRIWYCPSTSTKQLFSCSRCSHFSTKVSVIPSIIFFKSISNLSVTHKCLRKIVLKISKNVRKKVALQSFYQLSWKAPIFQWKKELHLRFILKIVQNFKIGLLQNPSKNERAFYCKVIVLKKLCKKYVQISCSKSRGKWGAQWYIKSNLNYFHSSQTNLWVSFGSDNSYWLLLKVVILWF